MISQDVWHQRMHGLVLATVTVGALLVPIVVIELTKRDLPTWLAPVVGAATCVPTAIALWGILHFIESSWRPSDASEQFNLKLWGVLYAQAAVFVYAPMVLRGDDDIYVPIAGAVVSWLAAIACAWAGFRAKKRDSYRLSLARLAETNPTLATRFLVRTDTKGWRSIQPENVLQYQDWFERALSAVGESEPTQRGLLTESQEKRLVAAAEDARLQANLWPGDVAALVLVFIRAPETERVRDRTEWAAAVATRTAAAELRESVDLSVSMLFRKHSKRFR